MAKLSQYLLDNRLSVRAFAERAELSPSYISEITNIKSANPKSPSLGAALKIQDATGGSVSVADWPKLAEIANAVHKVKHVTPETPIQDHTPELQPEGERE